MKKKEAEKIRNLFCELWCNLCDKYIDLQEVAMHYSINGHIIFFHKHNHFLEVEIERTL